MSGRIGDRRNNLVFRVESCLDDPQKEILVYYREDNIRCFVDLLNEEDVDVNLTYPQEQDRTILQIAVEEGKEDYVREILRRKDVDVNISNSASKRTPLHVAVEKGYVEISRFLIDSGADVNAKAENGNTPLHVAALRCSASWTSGEDQKLLQNNFCNIVQMLLQRNAFADAENNIGLTPIFVAAERGTSEIVRMLLKRGCCVTTEVDGESAEDFINQNMPSLKQEIRGCNRKSNNTVETRLFKALYSELSTPGIFIKTANSIKEKVDWNSNNGGHTFLQYACDHGYDHIVDFLLDCGSDPNGVCSNNRFPPLVLAGHHGYYNVIKVFKKKFVERGCLVDFSATDNNIKRENVLHKVLKAESKSNINKEYRNYGECLKILLLDENKAYKNNIAAAINGQDNLKNTPLHIAAQSGNHDAVRKLLRSEANIGLKNLKEETPVFHIAPDIMEEFLDDCLQGEGQITDDNFQMTFSYSFLGPPPQRKYALEKQPLLEDREPLKDLPETEPLWYMSQIKEHRSLLSHPVITSFLWMKWRRIRPYFYMNLLFYSLFVTIITSYILVSNTTVSSPVLPVQESQLDSGPVDRASKPSIAATVLKWISLVLLVIMTVRELCQICISVRRYIFSLENIGEVVLIILSFYVIFNPGTDPGTQHISGIIILLSWAEFVLLIGRHPRLSTYITMFNRVSWNFLSFLTWYIFFIISFGLCFFLIFHKPEGTKDEDGNEINGYFVDPGKAMLKTIVMSLTGEIEFEDLEFSLEFGKIIFLLWVFFIMLVLVNLLNGLAVSDISEIRREAEIVSCVSRVELISYIESILLGDPFQFLTNFPESRMAQKLPACNVFSAAYRLSCVKRVFSVFGGRRFLLFAERLRNKRAVFRPNSSKKEKSSDRHRDDLILSADILEDSKALLVKKNTVSETEEMKGRLQKIERTLRLLADQQNYVISKVNNIN